MKKLRALGGNFVFVVFEDPFVVGVLNFLAEVLQRKTGGSVHHLTIQGPFKRRVSARSIQRIRSILADDDFLIANPGMFRTHKGVAVFLRVQSEHLERVWVKPDYPKETFGFNPHITIYEGADEARASRAVEFLSKGSHRVELICRNFSVVPYASKQEDMFPLKGADGDALAMSKYILSGRVGSAFGAAFMKAVNVE